MSIASSICKVGLILGCSTTSAILLSAQPSNPQSVQRELPPKEIPFVLHVTTREVLIDVIAVDGRNRPVTNLTASELTVRETINKQQEIDESVSRFRLITPNALGASNVPTGGFLIAHNESCLERQSIHYELVYHPDPKGMASGVHDVHVTTSRRGVHLFYSHHYYVGTTAPPQQIASQTKAQQDRALFLDACSHPLVPPTISLRASPISTGATDLLRFRLRIDSESLTLLSMSEEGRKVQIDFGVCNFRADGHPLGFLEASGDQVLTSVEYARVQSRGVERILQFAPPAELAMTRFVVRDRATGNIGVTDVVSDMVGNSRMPRSAPLQPPGALYRDLEVQRHADFEHVVHHSSGEALAYFGGSRGDSDSDTKPVPGPVGSFGSVVPNLNAFCGDVFELQPGVRVLPDFRDFSPIGAIYTSSLAVPYQDLPPSTGIPGVTDRIAWFGVDYYATFWVTSPGEYEFELMSDDGAALQIDDKRIVTIDGLHTPRKGIGRIKLDEGAHSMHVPYFEGTPIGVALALWVRPPHGDWTIFDIKNFEAPPHSVRSQSLH